MAIFKYLLCNNTFKSNEIAVFIIHYDIWRTAIQGDSAHCLRPAGDKLRFESDHVWLEAFALI